MKTQSRLSLFGTLALASLIPLSTAYAQSQNSTKKIRVVPSEISKKSGSGVNWEPDFDSALAKSKATNKPIFWYVSTLNGTFMDRKREINRYMLVGPFSWPSIIETLNEHYVPVRTWPTKKQQQQLGLLPYKFIEPGFVILNPDGSEKFKIDRLTTFHIDWFQKLIASKTNEPANVTQQAQQIEASELNALAKKFAKPDSENGVLEWNGKLTEDCLGDLKLGMAFFQAGRQNDAETIWGKTCKKYPNNPLAWKAAAESEGFGPFVRGFEVHGKIPANVTKFDYKMAGTTAPPNVYSEDQVWKAGIDFFLSMQNEDGVFRDSDYDFGGTDSLPNVHVAVTSLAGMAMLEALERKQLAPEDKPKLINAINRAIFYVSDDSNINKADRDEILWAYAYRLRFLIRARKQIDTLKSQGGPLELFVKNSIKTLESVQSKRGSWYHEYNNPFVTATALMALAEAKKSGMIVDSLKVENGVKALSADRFGNGAFPYGSARGTKVKKKAGTDREISASAGRMPLCELGLWYWGKSNDEALANAIEKSFEGQKYLEKALKYDDHTSTLSYGGFFFWYDMRARSEAIGELKDEGLRKKLAKQQREIIMALPEIDGCFVDSHELGRVYGTAMALLSLADCAE